MRPDFAPLTLWETSRLTGAYARVEQRLQCLTGAWAAEEAADAAAPEAAVFLDALSARHAWHARLFLDLLPVVAGVDRATLVLAPLSVDTQLTVLASVRGAAERIRLLDAEVLPRLQAGYRHHLQRASRVTDAPLIRALELVARDNDDMTGQARSLLMRLRGDGSESAGGVTERSSWSWEIDTTPGLVPWPEASAG